eukprot:gene5024-5682_t
MMHDEDEGILSPPGCGAELSFYEEQYFHDNCDKVSRNCPYSAKMESRKLFGLSLEHDSEVPTWNLNDEDWENSSTESEQASKETNSKLAGKLSIGLATGLPGQEYLEDIYDAISQTGNQRLLQALENFVASTADAISQKNNENERLDAALRRATEKNSENARNLEEEMEQQILMLENKVREEEKRKAEKAIQDAQLKIEEKNHEITAIKEKLEQNLANQPAKENETAEEIKERDLENESLRSTLRESQTQLALYRTEIANLKSEYDEQGERLSKERQTVLRCVHEQESLTRQLQLLHEANRKLHDTNDDLRAAIENQKRMDEEAECMSPSKRNSLYGSPLGPYKKNPYARGSVTPSSQGSRSAVTSPTPGMDAKSVVSSPTSRPIDTNEFNESSLMSELMAADEQGVETEDYDTEGILNSSMGLPEGVLPRHVVETDFVDTDIDTDPEFVENGNIKQAFRNMNNSRASVVDDSLSAKEKEQMMEQLRILCDTNKRLSESNDELREALGLLSHSVKKKELKRSSKNSSRRSSLSDYNSSAPSRTDSRSSSRNSKSSKVDRPSSTSSPRRNPSRQHRKSSISTTSSEAEHETENRLNENRLNENRQCTCDYDCNNDNDICEVCKKPDNMVDEELIEQVTVQEDESELFVNTDMFDEPDCQCSEQRPGMTCEKCDELPNDEAEPGCKDVAVQADVTRDFPDENDAEISLHVCEGDGCVCREGDPMLPLDKSIQVSEVLLDQSKDQLEEDTALSEQNSERTIEPDFENDLRDEQEHLVEDNCLVCKNPIDASETLAGRCCCADSAIKNVAMSDSLQNEKVNNELQKAGDIPADTKSTLPDYWDTTSNYTDRETDARTQVTEPVSNDSLASAARRRQGIPLTRQDESASDTTSGINSSYSVIQNLEDELSMYARQQSDEEIDEDDMTIGELQRIKEMTSSGSDLDSDADVTYEERLPNGSRVEFSDNNANPDPDLRKPERTYKLVLAGDAAVGKSSFIVRLCKDKFYPSLNSTLGVDFQMKNMDIDGHLISLQLWDTAGQERFRSIAKSYFRRVDGVFLLYDVTSESSFLNVRDWTESIRDNSIKPVPIMLCGNKMDLRSSARAKDRPVITREQGEQLAQSIDAFFIETSSRSNTNITEAVQQLAR